MGMRESVTGIDLWFEFASTYSYVAIHEVAKLDARVSLRPFLLGPIFAAQGWNDSPFNIYPVKGRYMWRDLERICEKEGLQLQLPPFRFPQNSLKASRIALIGERDGWIAEFTRAVYVSNFSGQKDISDDATLGEILA